MRSLLALFLLHALPVAALAQEAPTTPPRQEPVPEEAPQDAPEAEPTPEILLAPEPSRAEPEAFFPAIDQPTPASEAAPPPGIEAVVVAVRGALIVVDAGLEDGVEVGRIAHFYVGMPTGDDATEEDRLFASLPEVRAVGKVTLVNAGHAQIRMGLNQRAELGDRVLITRRQRDRRLSLFPPRVGGVGFANVQLRGMASFASDTGRPGGGLFSWASVGYRAKLPIAVEVRLTPLSVFGPLRTGSATTEGGLTTTAILDHPWFAVGLGGGVAWGDRLGTPYAAGLFSQHVRFGAPDGFAFLAWSQFSALPQDGWYLDQLEAVIQVPLTYGKTPAWLMVRGMGGGTNTNPHVLVEVVPRLRLAGEGGKGTWEVEPSLGFLSVSSEPFGEWTLFSGMSFGAGVSTRY